MAEVTRVIKTAPKPAEVTSATVVLNPQEVAYLRTGLEYAFRAGNPYASPNKTIKDLYKTLEHAKNGKTQAEVDKEKLQVTLQDIVGFRSF